MSCRKAYEVDLAGYVADPTGAAWAEFRDHYPRCAVCAAEVRAWTEIHTALAARTHPDPDDLLRYVDAPGALSPKGRHAIADHLAGCAACRDEAHTLRTFDPLAAPAPARSSPRRFVLASFGRLVWNPAFAYAVALVLGLYPLLSDRLAMPPARVAQPTGPRVATTPAAPPAAERDEAAEKERVAEKPPADTRKVAEERARGAANAPDPASVGSTTAAAKPSTAPPSVAPPPPNEATRELADLVAKDAGAPAGGTAVARQALRRDEIAPRIVLRPGADVRTTIASAGPDVRLRVEGATPAVVALRLTDDAGRSFDLPWSPGGDDVRVPASWLRPGRYEVRLLAGTEVVGIAGLRVDAP